MIRDNFSTLSLKYFNLLFFRWNRKELKIRLSMFHQRYKTTEYSREILSWVQYREREVSPVVLRSPQLRKRRQLVEWTAEKAAELELSTQTVHTAVR